MPYFMRKYCPKYNEQALNRKIALKYIESCLKYKVTLSSFIMKIALFHTYFIRANVLKQIGLGYHLIILSTFTAHNNSMIFTEWGTTF